MSHATAQLKDTLRTHRRGVTEVGQTLVLIAVLAFIVGYFVQHVEYRWQWYRVGHFIVEKTENGPVPGLLLKGLGVTLRISGLSLLCAAAVGMIIAVLRLSRSFTGNLIAQIYLEGIRNTPLLIQLFFVYFVISPIFKLSPFASAVTALSLFEGAYASEIIRGAIVDVGRGQWEAAYSLGLSSFDTYRLIILPQALRNILPPLTSQAVSLIKDSALVSTIAIYDLTMRGNAIIAETYLTFEIWFVVAAIYLVINGSLSTLVYGLDRILRRTA